MVRIKALAEIDEERLRSLLRKRGHGVLSPGFLGQVKQVLEEKRKGEVHQCKCGELMILSRTHAGNLRRKYQSDDIPCKVCGRREREIFNWRFYKRLGEITRFLDERYIFKTKSAATLKPEDVKILEKMALGLFPTNTHAEMLVGYSDYMKALSEHFPKKVFETRKDIKDLFDKARKKNENKFKRLYYSLLDWEESHKAQQNIFGKQDIMSVLRPKDSLRSLEEDLVDKEEIDVEMAQIQLDLSTYQDTVEIGIYLDILANILNIIYGKGVVADPFKAIRLPSPKLGGKARKVSSLADKIEYFREKLPFNIGHMYNTHLRNAVAHNEYEIRVKERTVVLTKYDETLTFRDFESILHALKELHYAINSYLADYHIEKTRLEVRNQGIGALLLGYTDFLVDGGKLHPRAPCDAQLNIHQYWDFATFEKGDRVFPKFEIKIRQKNPIMIVDFGKNGALYKFPKVPEVVEWLEQLVLTGRLRIALSTIAPVLPIFGQKAIARVPVGRIMDVYILNVVEKTVEVTSDLIHDIRESLRI